VARLPQRDDFPVIVEIRERAWSPSQQILDKPMLLEESGEVPAAEPVDIESDELMLLPDDGPVEIDCQELTLLPEDATDAPSPARWIIGGQ